MLFGINVARFLDIGYSPSHPHLQSTVIVSVHFVAVYIVSCGKRFAALYGPPCAKRVDVACSVQRNLILTLLDIIALVTSRGYHDNLNLFIYSAIISTICLLDKKRNTI